MAKHDLLLGIPVRNNINALGLSQLGQGRSTIPAIERARASSSKRLLYLGGSAD